IRINLDMRRDPFSLLSHKLEKNLTKTVRPFLGGAFDFFKQQERHEEILAVLQPNGLVVRGLRAQQNLCRRNRARRQKNARATPVQGLVSYPVVTRNLDSPCRFLNRTNNDSALINKPWVPLKSHQIM